MSDFNLKRPKFPFGQITVTPDALRQILPQDIILGLYRHSIGDWGDVDEDVRNLNESSFSGTPSDLFSTYRGANCVRFWIITNEGRDTTTVHINDEF